MIASFIRAATAGSFSISLAISICSIRLPWLWPMRTNGRPLLLRREIIAPGGERRRHKRAPRRRDVDAGGESDDRRRRSSGDKRARTSGTPRRSARTAPRRASFSSDGLEIAVQALIARDGRVDVEAIERRVLGDRALPGRAIAVGVERGRRQRRRADIGAARQAQPARVLRIIGRRRRGWSLGRERARRSEPDAAAARIRMTHYFGRCSLVEQAGLAALRLRAGQDGSSRGR